MKREYINPPGWVPAPGYTPGVITSGKRLFIISGQVPLDPQDNFVGEGDFKAQVAQCFANIRDVLAAGGATFADVVKLTYFIVGMSPERLGAVREVRDEFLPKENRPASSAFGVTALFMPEAWVEIEAIAELPG